MKVLIIPPKRFWQRPKMVLLEPIGRAPKGFITDGKSAPWCMRWLFPVIDNSFHQDVQHDYDRRLASTVSERWAADVSYFKSLPRWSLRRYLMIPFIMLHSAWRSIWD